MRVFLLTAFSTPFAFLRNEKKKDSESSFVPVLLYRDFVGLLLVILYQGGTRSSSSVLYLVRISLLLPFLWLRLLVLYTCFLACLGIVLDESFAIVVECWYFVVVWRGF